MIETYSDKVTKFEKPISYKELAKIISEMTPSQQEKSVTIYLEQSDEFLGVQKIAETNVDDVVDSETPLLAINF